MAFPCYGLGVKSFWIAFVCAHQMPINKKALWSVIGVLIIFLLNCLRVMVIMIAMIEKWEVADYLGTNAHDLFNYLCYAALLGLILLFYAKTKSKGGAEHFVSPVKV
jgi:exosortase/archaeosortase family protein